MIALALLPLDDRIIVERAVSGDVEALAALLRRHHPTVVRHLQRYPFDAAEREALGQEVMQQVVRKLPSFAGDAAFTTWLYRVTANTALMRLRGSRLARTEDALRSAADDT